jgi:hypothetical protein
MTDPATLLALAKRCEQAAVPDAGLAFLGYRLKQSWNPIDIWNRRMKVVRISDEKNMGAMTAREATEFAYAEFLRWKDQTND